MVQAVQQTARIGAYVTAHETLLKHSYIDGARSTTEQWEAEREVVIRSVCPHERSCRATPGGHVAELGGSTVDQISVSLLPLLTSMARILLKLRSSGSDNV